MYKMAGKKHKANVFLKHNNNNCKDIFIKYSIPKMLNFI